ncbi:hypothetical protein J2Z31_003597 [Sinorhizobium kostiense]|uniref:Uncharacterized protein n=1 Tax=Sinorhizobium kostiense TaxID=76747 RepID=A0ABS4R2D6_9HYPH|nr:hypothetical protein [Sinorhizobium kostiense]MBP2237083.1 hypothetical protein [Sinorhizobium kostiense]
MEMLSNAIPVILNVLRIILLGSLGIAGVVLGIELLWFVDVGGGGDYVY